MYAGITLVMALLLTRPVDIPVAGICAVDYLTIENTMPSKQTTSAQSLDEWEIDLLAKCIEAEAGDQGYLGKCYVVDVILNRSEQWNMTIEEVIFQKGQFEVVSNNRIWDMKPPEETYRAIQDELKCRRNTEILYFCMYRWFDSWAEYMFTYPEDKPNNCHHYYTDKKKEKESEDK